VGGKLAKKVARAWGNSWNTEASVPTTVEKNKRCSRKRAHLKEDTKQREERGKTLRGRMGT